MPDRFDLERFVAAQAPVWDEVRLELAAGAKRTHWMWFVFPQLRGLGRSAMAERYGIAGLDEAKAYVAHPLLGARLREGAGLLLTHRGRSVGSIFGSPDDLKLGSSMTLFERAAPGEAAFADVLDAFFAGRRDDRTLRLLDAG